LRRFLSRDACARDIPLRPRHGKHRGIIVALPRVARKATPNSAPRGLVNAALAQKKHGRVRFL